MLQQVVWSAHWICIPKIRARRGQKQHADPRQRSSLISKLTFPAAWWCWHTLCSVRCRLLWIWRKMSPDRTKTRVWIPPINDTETREGLLLQHLFGAGSPVHSRYVSHRHWLNTSLLIPTDEWRRFLKSSQSHQSLQNDIWPPLSTHWCWVVDSWWIMEAVRQRDDCVTLVCVVSVPVGHSDLQSHVFIWGSYDGRTVRSEDTTRLNQLSGCCWHVFSLFLCCFTWPVTWKRLDHLLLSWSRTCTATPVYSGKCCRYHSQCLLRQSESTGHGTRLLGPVGVSWKWL